MVPMDPRKAAERVLEEAPKAPHFFDLSEAERLIWMLERAFMLGARAAGAGERPDRTEQTDDKNQLRLRFYGQSAEQN